MQTTRLVGLGIALSVGILGLGACGGGAKPSAATSTSTPVATTVASPTTATTVPASTIPTLPPSTTAAPTTSAPTTSTTVVTSTTSVPAPTTTAAAVAGCTTGELTAALGSPNGAAGSTYFTLTFTNQGSVTCNLFGYPGVSYVAGSAGAQVGSPAARDASVGGQATQTTVVLPPGGVGHAILRQVDVSAYPTATCEPTPVLGLRIYPPGQLTALFVPQSTTGCSLSGPLQMQIGFITP
jgi:Protein of unknown function (DUF4232)